MSYKFKISPKRKLYAALIGDVHQELYDAFARRAKKDGLTKSALAEKLEINKSLVTRKLNRTSNLSIRSLAELAWALDYLPKFSMTALEDINSNQPTWNEIYSINQTSTSSINKWQRQVNERTTSTGAVVTHNKTATFSNHPSVKTV